MDTVKTVEEMVLGMLSRGPRYAVSFRHYKRTVESLVKRGLIERCRPPGGAARNMLKLVDRTV